MKTTRRNATANFSVLLLALLGLSVFMFLNFTTVVVTGESMEPTFRNGNRVLASRAYWLIGPVRRKDIVVLEDPQKPGSFIIKRVLGLPGDAIDPANWPEDRQLTEGEYRVPAGTVYVVGDNYFHSEDSRQFGPVPMKDIRGKVVHLGAENGPVFAALSIALVAILLMLWMASNKVFAR